VEGFSVLGHRQHFAVPGACRRINLGLEVVIFQTVSKLYGTKF
jgi:hypothetical protein